MALEVTRACPRRCLYCYNGWKQPGPSDDPASGPDIRTTSDGAPGTGRFVRTDPADDPESQPDIRAVIDAALGTGRFVRADLTGGEPMSRPDFFDLLDLLRAHGVRPAVVTDGSLIGPDEARGLARRDTARAHLTVLSTDRDLHALLKGIDVEQQDVASGLDATLHAIALLVRAKVPVSVAFVCTRRNHDHLEEVARLCRALGVESLAFSRLCTTGEALRHMDLEATPAMVAACLAGLPELAQRYHLRIQSAVAVPHCVWPGGGRCSSGSGAPNFTVDEWGGVRPCSISSTVLGTLPKDDWETIDHRFTTDLHRKLRRALPKACRDCAHLVACGGGCRESGRASTGCWTGMDPLAAAALSERPS